MMPGSHQPLVFDATLDRLVLTEQIEGNMTQHGKILSRITLPNTAIIFTESHMQDPMDAILNTPPSGRAPLVQTQPRYRSNWR